MIKEERGKGWMTGMRGVYVVAAELAKRGLVVSPTSRSARGADLLVTDQKCVNAWSVQVKTNRKPSGSWLLNKDAADFNSDSHVYVFVNLKANDQRPEFFIVPSSVVACKMQHVNRPNSIWYFFSKADAASYRDVWDCFELSGNSTRSSKTSRLP